MRKVIFIGAGNVSTSLASAFSNAGWSIVQVYSRTIDSAATLAKLYNSNAISNLSEIERFADLYIIAVPDSSISEIIDSIPSVNGVVVHTSGSTPLLVLSTLKSKGIGVFYPFQTFSRSRIVDLCNVPIFVEAGSDDVLNFLTDIGKELSRNVSYLNSEKRLLLHLSGVFACNFTNHILALTYRLANENGIDFKVLQPLVEETVVKAFTTNPKDVQTGPAIRNDIVTMEKHSSVLGNLDEQLQRIYNELSLSIQKLGKL